MTGEAADPSRIFPSNLPADCTLLLKDREAIERVTKFLQEAGATRSPTQAQPSDTMGWALSFSDGDKQRRIQACRCYAGRALSVTIRSSKEQRFTAPSHISTNGSSGFEPRYRAKFHEYAFSIGEICGFLDKFLFPKADPERRAGLLVITGATSVAKSQVARGLIHLYLAAEMETWLKSEFALRKPHLVTFEDTLDALLYPLERSGNAGGIPAPGSCEAFGVDFTLMDWLVHTTLPDYTPRLLGKDVSSLADGIADALRQTPTVYFIAEVRDEKDWRQVIHLAESHLVVTTAHASGLHATFTLLRRALKVNSPQLRGELAQNILGVVHLRGSKVPQGPSFVLPALWRRTPQSVKSFSSDGLASIVPMFRKDGDSEARSDFYSPGRRAFATLLSKDMRDARERDLKELEERSSKDGADKEKADCDAIHKTLSEYQEIKEAIENKAVEWDLQGV